VKDRSTGVWSALVPTQTYVLATNDFIASGKDGYTTLGTVSASGRSVNTYLLYTQTFADWVVAQGSLRRPDRADYSHQRVVTSAGVELP
jgi:5'-nucleotidase